eukprot:3398561-Amphidinium_carterae.1
MEESVELDCVTYSYEARHLDERPLLPAASDLFNGGSGLWASIFSMGVSSIPYAWLQLETDNRRIPFALLAEVPME